MMLLGLTTSTFGCNYKRIFRSPNYGSITTPKKSLNVPLPAGICVADDGRFAVISWRRNGKFFLFHSCGKLMKAVELPRGYRNTWDCAFSGRSLYITDTGAKKIYKYSANGKFDRVIAGGESFIHIASCQGHLYVTVPIKNHKNVIAYYNDKETHRFDVPGFAEGLMIDMNGNINIPKRVSKQVLTYTPKGKLLGATTYKEVRHVTGIAMDDVGNLLVYSNYNSKSKVYVYTPCGNVVKIITGIKETYSIAIGNDGTVLVADYPVGKVYMY